MKKSMADKIEEYIKVLIARSDNRQIEIQRSELAETFSCVPSQVTYVISTRFTIEEGYYTESRRGGAGFVRISEDNRDQEVLQHSGFNETLAYLISENILKPGEDALILRIALAAMRNLSPELKERIAVEIRKELIRMINPA